MRRVLTGRLARFHFLAAKLMSNTVRNTLGPWELEPIRTFMDLSFGEDQTDLRQQIQQTLEYGSFSDVGIPSENSKIPRGEADLGTP